VLVEQVATSKNIFAFSLKYQTASIIIFY
jgi:hypothetical protein